MPLHFLQLSVRTKRPFQKGLFTLTLYRCYILMYPSAPLSGPNSPLPYVRGTEQRLARPSRLSRPCAASGARRFRRSSCSSCRCCWHEPNQVNFLTVRHYQCMACMVALHFVSCCLWPLSRRGHRCEANPLIYKHTETMLDSLAMGLFRSGPPSGVG